MILVAPHAARVLHYVIRARRAGDAIVCAWGARHMRVCAFDCVASTIAVVSGVATAIGGGGPGSRRAAPSQSPSVFWLPVADRCVIHDCSGVEL
eukprot:gene9022-biopygen6082